MSVLSTIVPSRNLSSQIESRNSVYKMQFGGDTECLLRVLKQKSLDPIPDLIKFVNPEGTLIDAIPKERLTSGSEYFRVSIVGLGLFLALTPYYASVDMPKCRILVERGTRRSSL